MSDAIALASRILLSLLFLVSGFGKLGAGYAGAHGYMASMGVPGALLPWVIALEVGGAAALLVGFMTRWTALALAAFSVGSAVLFHADFGDASQSVHFLKNLSIAGGMLMLYLHGPGAFSVDSANFRRHPHRILG